MKNSILFMIVICLTGCANSYVIKNETGNTRIINRPGIIETTTGAATGLVVGVGAATVGIVGGVLGGVKDFLLGHVEVIDASQPAPQQTAYSQPAVQAQLVETAAYYYSQPMYSAAPFYPGYAYNYWYWLPNNYVVFVTNGQHRRHGYNHGGYYGGQSINYKNGGHSSGSYSSGSHSSGNRSHSNNASHNNAGHHK